MYITTKLSFKSMCMSQVSIRDRYFILLLSFFSLLVRRTHIPLLFCSPFSALRLQPSLLLPLVIYSNSCRKNTINSSLEEDNKSVGKINALYFLNGYILKPKQKKKEIVRNIHKPNAKPNMNTSLYV